jgi:glutamate-ammonia-ligase adenylyltransferase
LSGRLAKALAEALASGVLLKRFQQVGGKFLERYGNEDAARFSEPMRRGLARLLASSSEAAGFLARRPTILERLATLDVGYLERRSAELCELGRSPPPDDLETFLDQLRLLRREEVLCAACLDLSGAVSFEAVSRFLSELAGAIVSRALRMAEEQVPVAAGDSPVSVLGLGKLAGREFTYHSDLDLIFLYDGGPEQIDRASRVAQRLVGYLTTMTGAGVAYAVDARLRPSGQQGTLVASLHGFERYQREEAETWEHLAVLRSRAIAGDVRRAQAALDRVRSAILRTSAPSWGYIADLRRRVEEERARAGKGEIAFKTGRGGIMDVEFLASGGLLERGRQCSSLPETRIPAMLAA